MFAPPPAFDLSASPVEQGGDLVLTVAGAPPSASVGIFFGPGLDPGTSCPPQLGGTCLDISQAVLFRSFSVDASGNGSVSVSAPAMMLPGREAFFQAGIVGGVSAVVAVQVQPADTGTPPPTCGGDVRAPLCGPQPNTCSLLDHEVVSVTQPWNPAPQVRIVDGPVIGFHNNQLYELVVREASGWTRYPAPVSSVLGTFFGTWQGRVRVLAHPFHPHTQVWDLLPGGTWEQVADLPLVGGCVDAIVDAGGCATAICGRYEQRSEPYPRGAGTTLLGFAGGWSTTPLASEIYGYSEASALALTPAGELEGAFWGGVGTHQILVQLSDGSLESVHDGGSVLARYPVRYAVTEGATGLERHVLYDPHADPSATAVQYSHRSPTGAWTHQLVASGDPATAAPCHDPQGRGDRCIREFVEYEPIGLLAETSEVRILYLATRVRERNVAECGPRYCDWQTTTQATSSLWMAMPTPSGLQGGRVVGGLPGMADGSAASDEDGYIHVALRERGVDAAVHYLQLGP